MKSLKKKTRYPLADAQKTLIWSLIFSVEKENAKRENNIPLSFYDPSPDSSILAMEQAFNRLIEMNDALRLRIFFTLKGIRQCVSDYTYTILSKKEINNLEEFEAEKEKVYDNIINYRDEHLYTATLYTLPDRSCGIIMNFHHMAIDGYSCSLIIERFEQYYTLLKKSEPLPKNEKKYSILPFLEAEIKYKKSKYFKEDFKYWWKKYNHQPGYSFSAGHRSLHGYESICSFSFNKETVIAIRELQHKIGFSDQAFVLAISAIATYCLTGKKVFMHTSLTHGRRNFVLKKTIGCMMNPVPLVFHIDPSITAEQFIKDTFMNLLDVLSHAKFPMSYQMIIGLKYCFLRGFNFLHFWYFVSLMDFGKSITQSDYQWDMVASGFIAEPLYCYLSMPSEDEMVYHLQYQNRKFSPEKIHKMIETYQQIVLEIIKDPHITINDLKGKIEL